MFNYHLSVQALQSLSISSCGTPSLSSCTLCRNISTFSCNCSFATCRRSQAASALGFSNLIVDYCSSNSSFLSSRPNCIFCYCLLSIICSLSSFESSVKSDEMFILLEALCAKLSCILHLRHVAFVKNKLSNILTKNDYIRSYC